MTPLVLAAHIAAALRAAGVPEAAPLVAAVSGGPDSMAMLAALAADARLRARTTVAHLDHGLRAAGPAEARLVADAAARLGVPARFARLDPASLPGGNLPERLREARYAFLLEVAGDAGFVLTAHHADDQAVTMLMRFIEGAALPGVAGMAPRRGRIVHPLLEVPHEALRAAVAAAGLAVATDPSNADPARFRNRVRNEIWPLIVRERPQAARAAAHAARRLREDDEALQMLADRVLERAESGFGWVEIPLAAPLPPAVLRRVVNSVLHLRWRRRSLAADQWPATLAALEAGTRAALPGRVTIEPLPGRLLLSQEQPPPAYTLDISAPGVYILPVGALHVGAAQPGSIARAWRPGDSLAGGRRVADELRRLGRSRHRRAGYPVIAGRDGSVTLLPPPEANATPVGFEERIFRGRSGLETAAQTIVEGV